MSFWDISTSRVIIIFKEVCIISDDFKGVSPGQSSGEKKPMRDNVILFPKTIDYYQFELTRHLEQEHYLEAIELLRFLTSIQSEDEQALDEWRTLLGWLESQYGVDLSKEEETEQDILRNHVLQKSENDHKYIQRLLHTLRSGDTMEHKLLALEQLAFIQAELPINEELIEWLTDVTMHPLLQFKILQTLRIRGYEGKLTITRNGEKVEVDYQQVPLDFSDYPKPVAEVIRILRDVCEVTNPALFYFAEQIWNEWLACNYGTHTYNSIRAASMRTVKLWAASLHVVSCEIMTGQTTEHEIVNQYGIEKEEWFQWEQACRILRNFLKDNPYS